MKPYRKDRLWANKKQKELHIGDSSNHWLKEKSTKNSIIEMARTVKVSKEKAKKEKAREAGDKKMADMQN